jgi:hypothetical protein
VVGNELGVEFADDCGVRPEEANPRVELRAP